MTTLDTIKKLAIQFILFVWLYLTPILETGLIILLFVCFDFVTGVWASLKEGNTFTSSGMKRSVVKYVVYGIALIVSLMFSKHFGLDILTVVAFFIGSIEVKSIFENLYRITNINFLNAIVEILGNYAEKLKGEK